MTESKPDAPKSFAFIYDDLIVCGACGSNDIKLVGNMAYCRNCKAQSDRTISKPVVMRAGKCELRDKREGVASEITPDLYEIELKSSGLSHKYNVNEFGRNLFQGESIYDVVAMLDDEPDTESKSAGELLKVYICQKCGNRHDGIDVYWETEHSRPLCSKCRPEESKPDALVIEGECVLYIPTGETVTHKLGNVKLTIHNNSFRTVDAVVTLKVERPPRPHTPAPKVYRMVDETYLYKFATCYAQDINARSWYQFENVPTLDITKPTGWDPHGKWEMILDDYEPKGMPDDFDYRDSLVMVDGK